MWDSRTSAHPNSLRIQSFCGPPCRLTSPMGACYATPNEKRLETRRSVTSIEAVQLGLIEKRTKRFHLDVPVHPNMCRSDWCLPFPKPSSRDGASTVVKCWPWQTSTEQSRRSTRVNCSRSRGCGRLLNYIPASRSHSLPVSAPPSAAAPRSPARSAWQLSSRRPDQIS